ncbi:MAG: hypothetical protein QNJ07_04940 [Woeseiaceae bacterium]|nr:hypothetical protein [Woeseiaceae bacterium]
MNKRATNDNAITGEFIDFSGERFYAIRNVDRMEPFFISVVSNVDHWLFVSSTGGLTAGRVSPASALFPYVTVDKIHDSTTHTGCKTVMRIKAASQRYDWEPFNREHDGIYAIRRNLYKNVLGNKICFEEINEDLELAFRYTWATSEEYGFVRLCELENLGYVASNIEIIDGLQNILPASTPLFTQTNSSNLVDAYKWTELDEASGLAIFSLYSRITDRAEPAESLKANTTFCLGLDDRKILISADQLRRPINGTPLEQERHKRGVRGAFFVNAQFDLPPESSRSWQFVADVEQSQARVVELRRLLGDTEALSEAISRSIAVGSERLARIMAAADGFQSTAEENVSIHHYANVLFNTLRGGIFDDQYNISSRDFAATVRHFNRDVYKRSQQLLAGLPGKLGYRELLATVTEHGDPQLKRLCYEYLPITFGRRHGDPSRPWNQFAIRLRDEHGNPWLSYEGNWRDIFQNWEALALSYPEFVENMIAKFVNASTADGYNPYRITKEGIDWEVEDPEDPWSYIGYWGDHQIIYLQKLLELSVDFHPERLSTLLHEPVYCYANVPYRIADFEALLANPKSTISYDDELAEKIEQRLQDIGADGKLLLDSNGLVYRVTLLEKLLVPLLAKLSNLVIDGGIWMNTQRPEWNDANNALVGQGLSMVTLYYLRRYVRFLDELLANESESSVLSSEVSKWLAETAAALSGVRGFLGSGKLSAAQRYELLSELGQAASRYREAVYGQQGFSGKVSQPLKPIRAMLDDALAAIDHSIGTNRRSDGLYHAYNLLDVQQGALAVDNLYPMLEGQVAALSAGAIDPAEAVEVLEALYESDVYRADQDSFMLYPDRPLPGFLEKNRIAKDQVDAIPLLAELLAEGDERIFLCDGDGEYRFSSEFSNASDLDAQLDQLAIERGDAVAAAREPLRQLFEQVFDHQAFTGRSGTMFGFEGLGSIYWHMVSKLLLAVEENFFAALAQGADDAVIRRLGELYYRVREGIGFNKTPEKYGAFPTDPYSHTPGHSGAKQPGMTGQVKEEVIARYGELGVRVAGGTVRFQPALLRAQEFNSTPLEYCYLDVDDNWQNLTIPDDGLAFSWCQVPVVYRLSDESAPSLTVTFEDGSEESMSTLALSPEQTADVCRRNGRIRRISVSFTRDMLLSD